MTTLHARARSSSQGGCSVEEEAIDRAAEAIAATPLNGCMDDNGDCVYMRHIWPADAGKLKDTLKKMARAAITAYQSNSRGR